jgi:tetratricopeptide (TPR) repeat protein
MSDRLQALCDEADELRLHGLSRELTQRLLETRPDDYRLLLELATHELTFCRYEEAKAAIDHAERVCPPDVMKWVLTRKGQLSEGLGDFEASMAYHLAAHEMDPNDATHLIFAGCAAFQAGRTEEAIELATRATQCRKGCIDEAYYNLGGYLLALRRYDEARDCYLSALEIDPEYKIAKTRLEDVSRILALEPENPNWD